MAMIEINWKPARKELRQFAAIWLVFFGLIGAWSRYKTGSYDAAMWWWLVAAGVGLPGLVLPALLRPIFVGWMLLAYPIGWTVSHLLLGTLYYLVLTPIGLLVRALGNDPMNRRFERDAKSYWVEHRTGDEPSSYFRQF